MDINEEKSEQLKSAQSEFEIAMSKIAADLQDLKSAQEKRKSDEKIDAK